MDEKQELIAKVTKEATKKAETKKMNAAQTKIFVESEVQKATERYENELKEQTTSKGTQTTSKKSDAKEKRYIVHTPVRDFCGEVAGVQFAYGKAEVKSGWVLNWFKEHGYIIEEISK